MEFKRGVICREQNIVAILRWALNVTWATTVVFHHSPFLDIFFFFFTLNKLLNINYCMMN